MTTHEAFNVGVRLLGVYFLAIGVLAVPNLLPLLNLLDGMAGPSMLWPGLHILIQPAIQIGVGLYLLRDAAVIFHWAGLNKP